MASFLVSIRKISGGYIFVWFLALWCARFEPKAGHVETEPVIVTETEYRSHFERLNIACLSCWICRGTDSKQLYLLCIKIVERKICYSKCDGSGWSYQQRKKRVHRFLPSGSKDVREPPTFLCSRVSCLKASQELQLYKQVKYWWTFMKHWQMIPVFSLNETARISAAARFLIQQHWSVPDMWPCGRRCL